jgi:hypothetical protein
MLTRVKGTAASTADTCVHDLYRELAARRAARARAALSAAPSSDVAFHQSAAALEDAAAALSHAATTGAAPEGTEAEELNERAAALISAAARFEAAGDAARRTARELS